MTKPADRRDRPGTASRQQALNARLIDAAEAAVASGGLENVRARALAEAAGCSVGAIYGVVDDLDALVLEVNGRTLDAIAAALAAVSVRGGPGEHLVRLAETYLAYAAANVPRWRAVFRHAMPEGRPVPPSYAERQRVAFSFIERPLADLLPALSPAKRVVLARTLFSAVHGMVDLGLDEKVASLTPAELRAQIRLVVGATAAGLAVPAGAAAAQSASARSSRRSTAG